MFWLVTASKKDLICPPGRLGSDDQMYLSALEQCLDRTEGNLGVYASDSGTIAILLSNALIDTFPCK